MKRHDIVEMNKDGIFGLRYSKEHGDYVLEGIDTYGGVKFFRMNANTPFCINGNVTLRDFISILLKMTPLEIERLSSISNANIEDYLIDFENYPEPQEDDDGFGKLTAIEVYKCLEFSNWDSCGDVFRMDAYTSAHGVGEIWEQSMKDVKEGRATLDEVKECNTYAIEFTPWQKMLDIPIKIQETFRVSETVWKKVKPKEWKVGVIGSRKKFSMGKLDRELVKKGKLDDGRKVKTELTMQEFFTGLFNELCFFSSPKARNAEMEVLNKRIEDVEKITKKKKKK